MWNGLFFGLVSLFTPQASLPDTAAMEAEIHQFAQVYSIDTGRIHVRKSTMNNPSPFLTNSGVKACVLHVNQHADAKRVWSHFLDTGHEGSESAFLAFTSAHELTHCLMSEKGKRVAARQALQQHLGVQFKNNMHFEETLADLVGLAYVQKVAPEYYDVVFKRVKSIRTDFSNRDPEHDSSQALQAHTIAFAAQLFAKPQNVRLADASVR
ncbi:hypothetical protein LHL20_04855 [Alteromonas sp. McT4-15]|jgi:hypothetical protein|uniref:Uncharacterized protein n=1 Tax=Pseudoalteromonas lipolytica TaxID=570156 RepID=A0AAD0WEL0_9GAMM|nr:MULTISPECIES: hypothetical protein [Pseudomonadota]HAV74463.1 hypothetical protein [Limnobacter sp.]AXV67658.1 hypothetical protein D0907_20205 [Pseudoalteromonas donghaensis]MAB15546.1 hypothetical protein [Parvibaculum sp.]MAB53568.1 hypothetical protein [Marinobacter sp.]MCB4435569.1 hypothetical protein [Alteromonas sp. McT4-15]|tara:strand:- start:4498 stop:5127 length:630 start_codon:yes stop_codon:yes gene_type:complete